MILSGRDIAWYMSAGALRIFPVTDDQFQQNGIDLILEDVDTHPDNFTAGRFYLGHTREVLAMPNDLMAFVELRSTWARKGIMLPPTIVDAGFEGDLTLELASFTNGPVPYGQRFAHLIFAKLTSPSIPYKGKYQHQRGITRAKEDK